MRKLVLKRLELKNFKGQTRTFEPKEDLTKVFAKNGKGKTTLYKAFCWMLSGYTDAINVKNHELYDNRTEITPDTPTACVKAYISIDGVDYTIERRAIAKFTRKRSTNEYVKDASDTYELYIDEVSTSSQAFAQWVGNNICDTDLLVYALIGERFANLVADDKKKARAILEMISGNVTIDMMSGDYSMIADDLSKFSVEQLKERYRNTIKPMIERNTEIDSLIESKESELSKYKETDFVAILAKINTLTSEISKCDASILDKSEAIKPIMEEKKKIMEKVNAIMLDDMAKRNEWNARHEEGKKNLLRNIAKVNKINDEIKAENAKNKATYEYNVGLLGKEKERLDNLNTSIQKMRERKDSVKSQEFSETKCPACGQELPIERIEELKDKFNEDKKARLAEIITQGKILKSEIDSCNDRIRELESIIAEGASEKPYESVESMEEEYDLFVSSFVPYDETKEHEELMKNVQSLKESIPCADIDVNEIVSKKERLQEELGEANRAYGIHSVMERIEHEIHTLKAEKRELNINIAKIEGCIDKVKEYEEEKANIVSDAINKKLSGCKIVMYSRLKSGDLVPDCVIESEEGIKYATMNNSARLITCLSLQRMFCEKEGINLPIFVDEASIYDSEHLPKFDSQTIYLYASDDENMLIK